MKVFLYEIYYTVVQSNYVQPHTCVTLYTWYLACLNYVCMSLHFHMTYKTHMIPTQVSFMHTPGTYFPVFLGVSQEY